MRGPKCPFYDSSWLLAAVKDFHDHDAQEPDDKEAREVLVRNTQEIEKELRNCGMCQHLEYTGSSYEGVKVCKNLDDPDHEYDVMIIMPHDKVQLQANTSNGSPGYATIRQVQKMRSTKILIQDGKPLDTDECGNILSAGVRSRFVGKIQRIIEKSDTMRGTSQLIDHGPAVQIDVYKDFIGGTKLYSVDMVPAYQIKKSFYVAKPLPGEQMADALWRKSCSLKEKKRIKNAGGDDKGCRNEVLRIVKAIRNRDTTLKWLSSFHFKTEWLKDLGNKTPGHWDQDKIGKRTIDVFRRLYRDLRKGGLLNFFDPNVNLFSSLKHSIDVKEMIQNRVLTIIKNPRDFKQLIEPSLSQSSPSSSV